MLLFIGLVLAAIWFGFRRGAGNRLAMGLLVALTLDGFLLDGWFGHGMNALFPLIAIACGIVVPWMRRPWPAIVIFPLSVAAALTAWLRGGSADDAFTVWYATLISGFIIATILRLFAAIRELRDTREELARTAVSEERLRFARDLHDLLGHTLSIMVIKAQAVRKLIPRDGDLAAEQAGDIETIGRDALRQVRLAVTGYRGRGLAAEIDGARTALRDAGIDLVVRQEGTPLPEEAGALLGWAVREGMTNVIRHSGAGRCEISVAGGDSAVLVIRDDGRGGPPVKGNGLHGLTERISGAGGRLEAGPSDSGGYVLTVTLPLGTPLSDVQPSHDRPPDTAPTDTAPTDTAPTDTAPTDTASLDTASPDDRPSNVLSPNGPSPSEKQPDSPPVDAPQSNTLPVKGEIS